jgi:hypothetical protein
MSPRKFLSGLFLFAALIGPIAPAFAAAPPAVPSLPDTERRTAYSITGTTCICAVNFAIYGDSTDVDEWIQVWVGGVRYLSTDATFGWSLSSATGPLATIPRPITDAVLTFNNVQTGTVQIVGARRPRRTSQFLENRGVAARDLNQALTDIISENRELWDKTSDLSGRGLFFAPGNTTGPMPSPSACANGILGFDATGLNPKCTVGAGTGTVTGPASSTVGHVALWNNNGGTLLSDGSPTITINGTGCTLGGSCSVAGALTVGVSTISGGTPNGLFFDSSGVLGNLATTNNGVLVTSGSGVPSISATLPSGITLPSPTVTGAFTATGLVTNADLANSAVTVGGAACTLGGSNCQPAITAGTTTIASGANNALLVESSGKVAVTAPGFGNTAVISANAASPSANGLVQIIGVDAGFPLVDIDSYTSGSSSGGLLNFRTASGTGASPSAVPSSTQLGAIEFNGYGTAFGSGAEIYADATQNWTGSAHGTNLTFATTPSGSTSITAALILGQDQSATFEGGITAASLATPSSNIAGSICATAGGVLLYQVGTNCIVGGAVTIGSTTVSGGSAGNLLYTDGTDLQATGGITFNGTGQETHALGTITANKDALSITGTWNASGVTFDAPLLVNITNTASHTGSALADFQVGGSSVMSVQANTGSGFEGVVLPGSGNLLYLSEGVGTDDITLGYNGEIFGLQGGPSVVVAWGSISPYSNAGDVSLSRLGAGNLMLSDNTTGAKLTVSRSTDSYTSRTNFADLTIDAASVANTAVIGTNHGGTSTWSGLLQFNVLGSLAFDYGVTVSSKFNSAGGYASAGTAGVTKTCGATIVVTGGIITSC